MAPNWRQWSKMVPKWSSNGTEVAPKVDRISKNQRLHRHSLICKGLEVPMEASMLFSSVDRTGRGELLSRIMEAGEGIEDR